MYDSEIFQGKQYPEAYVAMEFCPGGSLAEAINVRVPDRLPGIPEKQIWEIFYQICEAVAFMHSQSTPIIHRDLKAENVLVRHNPKPSRQLDRLTLGIYVLPGGRRRIV